MQGYTEVEYRRAWLDVYGMPCTMYTPFLRVDRGEIPRRDLRDALSPLNAPQGVVPQIIVGSMDEFGLLTSTLKGNGFKRIDINLGCPFPPQVKRGRGAGALLRLDFLAEMAQAITHDTDCRYSVKMRAGATSHTQWHDALTILNTAPLTHITMHPRIASDQYRGHAHRDVFEEFATQCRHNLVYNGDITSPEQISEVISQFKGIQGLMIGRGLLARPSLVTEYTQGRTWSHTERLEAIAQLHSRYRQLLEQRIQGGDHQLLTKLKPFWDHLEPEIGHKTWKAIHKSTTLRTYNQIVL